MSQLTTLTGLAFRSLPARWGSALVLVIGMVGVTAVTTSLFSIAVGFQKTFTQLENPLRVMVFGKQSENEANTQISREQAPAIINAPGIAVGADGKPLAMVEKVILGAIAVPEKDIYQRIQMRGVTPNVFDVRPEASLVEGRMFETGKREVIVGVAAARSFSEIELGRTIEFSDEPFTIVGLFEMDGSFYETNAWADREVVMSTYSQTGLLSTATALLESPAAFETLKAAVEDSPELDHRLVREASINKELMEPVLKPLRYIGLFVGIVMGLGVLFSSVSAASTVIARRSKEIATLRAVGYSGGAAAGSVVIEVVLLSALGGLLGALIALVLFDGYSQTTVNSATFTQIAFNFRVTPAMIGIATGFAAAIGLLGALVPAMRASRRTISSALTASG